MKPFTITLTVAAMRLLGSIFERAEELGDCVRDGSKVTFEDYEGANATLNKLTSGYLTPRPLRRETHVEYKTRLAVWEAINAGILQNYGRGKK
jgi:hypothetical protein